MHVPPSFAMSAEQVREVLVGAGAGDLVTMTAEGLCATFLPFVLDPDDGEHGALLGHLARSNDQWRRPALADALVVVHGPDGYVSPGWYPSKAEHGRVVPTWNHVTVHVHGRLTVHDDATWVADQVARLTDQHEAGRAEPWAVTDAPERFVAGQLRAIVGVHLAVTRVEATAKLSQNRPPADVDGVVRGARADGRDALADAVVAARTVTPDGQPGTRAAGVFRTPVSRSRHLGQGQSGPGAGTTPV